MPCPNKQNVSLAGCDALGCDTLSQGRIPWAWMQEFPHYWPARPQGVTTRRLTTVRISHFIARVWKCLETRCSVFRHPTRVPSAEGTFGSFPKWWHAQLFDDSYVTVCWVSRYCLVQYHVDDCMETDDFKWHCVGLSLGTQIQNGHSCFINNEKTKRRKLLLQAGRKTMQRFMISHGDFSSNNVNGFHYTWRKFVPVKCHANVAHFN
jgi:hypothetical protein